MIKHNNIVPIVKVCSGLLLLMLTLSSCHQKSYDEKISQQTAESNQNCPQRMDQYTVLDSMHYDIPTRTMGYYYSIQGDMDVDTAYTDTVVEAFRTAILKNLRSSIDIKELKDSNTNFVYVYTSQKSKRRLMQLKYTPKDYK